ncbi:MAG: Uma2 family endonuclease [Anaerolineae bacterium]
MVAMPSLKLTVEEFDRWILLHENVNRDWEYIAGEVVEVVSNGRSSDIASRILIRLGAYVLDHDLGFMTTTDGGYMVMGERYIPDVAFVSKSRQAESLTVSYNPIAPDLAVEVLSPSNSEQEIRVKTVNYLAAGTIVWIVDPALKRVEIYQAGERVRLLSIDDTIDGGALLPGFALPVKSIFPPEKQEA